MGWFEDNNLSDPSRSGLQVDYGDFVTTPPLGTSTGSVGNAPPGENPGSLSPLPPGTTTPPKTTTPTSTGGGNTSVEDFVAKYGHLPWVGNDLGYWIGVINNSGGLSSENMAYWATRMTDPPGVGSNAGNLSSGSGSLRSTMGPPPAMTAAPNIGSAPFREAPNVGAAPFREAPTIAPAPFQAAPDVGAAPFTPYEEPTPFAYDPFQAPDPNKVKEDPAYQFRLKAGNDALAASKAAQGVLRTGGTLKDISAWNSEFATQEYDKIYGRAMDEWRSGFDVSKGTYDTNTANDRFAYTANQGGLMDQWKANTDVAMNQWTGTNQGLYNQWLGNTNTAMDQWTGTNQGLQNQWQANTNAALDTWSGTNQGLYNQWAGNASNEMDIWKATNASTMAQWAAQYGMSQDEIDNLLRMAGIGSTAAAGAPAPVPGGGLTGYGSVSGAKAMYDAGAGAVQPNGQAGGLKDLYRDLPSQDSYKTNGWAY